MVVILPTKWNYEAMLQVERLRQLAGVILSPTICFALLCLFLRPRDEGVGKLMYHMILIALATSDIAQAILQYKYRNYYPCGFLFAMIPVFVLVYRKLLQIRKRMAQLPPAELSNFLCNQILLKSVGSIAPVILFSLEALSCMTPNYDEYPDPEYASLYLCEGTMTVSMLLYAPLSLYYHRHFHKPLE